MNAGQYISGAGHIGLIGWLLFGGVFNSEPLPFEVTEVAVITGEQFEALMAAARPPQTATEVAMPTPPVADTLPAPQIETAPDAPPVESAAPEAAATPPPDPAPDVSQVTPPAPAEVQDSPPEITPPTPEVAVLVPERSARPQARPIERVAPTPVAPPPEPEVKPEEVVREDVAEKPAEVVRPKEEAAAPQEAVTEIVPDAQDKVSAAPAVSKRPQARPQRTEPKPETRTASETAPARPEGSSKATEDAVKSALAEALAGGGDATPIPSGPPLTQGERDSLRVAVSKCWNLGALSSDAMAVTITVAVKMTEDARPVTNSITLAGSSGGSAAAANQAFEAARRAIIRCGARGYKLPTEKFEQWRDIEMTFNPEKMR